jgi:sporulation protein YlmC with PRC-barrel domain
MELNLFEGKAVESSDGERIGTVSQTYKDSVSGRVEWLLVDPGFGEMRPLLVPAPESPDEEQLCRVPYTAAVISEQPEVEAEAALVPETLSILASYFGLGSEDEDEWNPVVT